MRRDCIKNLKEIVLFSPQPFSKRPHFFYSLALFVQIGNKKNIKSLKT